MLTIVVAHYNENISWLNQVQANIVVLSKSQIINAGREASSYAWFLWKNYDLLYGDYVFCQGNPFDHCNDFFKGVTERRRHYGLVCRWPECHVGSGLLNESELCDFLMELTKMTGIVLDVDLSRFFFAHGAQFMASADEIRARSKSFYEAVYHIAISQPRAAWALEALWGHVIPAVRMTDKTNDEVHFGKTK
jgi:hypothetical protein